MLPFLTLLCLKHLYWNDDAKGGDEKIQPEFNEGFNVFCIFLLLSKSGFVESLTDGIGFRREFLKMNLNRVTSCDFRAFKDRYNLLFLLFLLSLVSQPKKGGFKREDGVFFQMGSSSSNEVSAKTEKTSEQWHAQ